MSNRYYISDHHFGHANIRRFEPYHRPDVDVVGQAEWLVAQHNSRIKKNDLVIFGGDVGVGKDAAEFLSTYLPQMNGQKHLILGNHDDLSLDFYQRFFAKVRMCMTKTYKDTKVWISHVPIHPSELEYRCGVNLHGHLHSKVVPKDSRYVNFCVEHCDGIPRTLEEWMQEETL